MVVTESNNGSWYATVTDADLAPGQELPSKLGFLLGGRGVWSVDVLGKDCGEVTDAEIIEAVMQRIPWANPERIALQFWPR